MDHGTPESTYSVVAGDMQNIINNGVLQETIETPKEYSFEFLQEITVNFSKERLIGSGGYGAVYKGLLDGKEVAVKKLYMQPGLGDDKFNECINLMRVQHQNIVPLIGYCYKTEKKVAEYNGKLVFADEEQRVLVLEYLQGGSLDGYLSDEPCKLDWCICYRIIKGICEGLKYLHTGSKNPIYHLDLKPPNVLLDIDMTPKIGDFGLSRLLTSSLTFVVHNPIGTFGYMPREYIDEQVITSMFDVFSLGVVILQIMAGRAGCSQHADVPSKEFVELVHRKWEKRLEASTSWEVKTCLELALRCVEDDRAKRPTIAEIVDKLNKIDTVKSSSTGQVFDFGSSKQDSNEQCASKENRGVTILAREDADIPDSEPMDDSTDVEENLGVYKLVLEYEEIPETQPMVESFSLTSPIVETRSAIHSALGLAMFLIALGVIVATVLVLCFVVVPNVKVDIGDARLDSFTLLDTTQAEKHFLVYNISGSISVRNPSDWVMVAYSSPLVAALVFHGQSLDRVTFADKGQQPPMPVEDTYKVNLVGEHILDAAEVEDYKKQNATGMFTVEVRISGKIVFVMERKLSLSCRLNLRLLPSGSVAVQSNKVNCVPV